MSAEIIEAKRQSEQIRAVQRANRSRDARRLAHLAGDKSDRVSDYATDMLERMADDETGRKVNK